MKTFLLAALMCAGQSFAGTDSEGLPFSNLFKNPTGKYQPAYIRKAFDGTNTVYIVAYQVASADAAGRTLFLSLTQAGDDNPLPVTYSVTGQAISLASQIPALPVVITHTAGIRIVWSQSYVGSTWFNTEGMGRLSSGGVAIKQTPQPLSGAYTFTLDGAVDPTAAVVNIATFTQTVDNTNQSLSASASGKNWPWLRLNLSACSACSNTRFVTFILVAGPQGN